VTLREGPSFGGTFTIAPDATNGCVSNGSSTASATSPILFTSGQTTSTTPPATLTASGGAASLTVATGGYATPAAGCVYHISDGSGTSVTFKIVSYLPGSYTPCPGTHLYVNNDNTGLISYALPLTSSSVGTQLEGQDQTTWLSFDPSCNAYISEYEYSFSPAGVLQFASPYTSVTSSYTGASGTLVYGVAVDGAGHLFLDETNANQVVELSSFSNSATVLNTLPVTAPYAIAFDSQANLYVGGSTGISVFAYPYSSTTPTQTILSGVNIQGIAFDANNDLFAVGQNTLYELSSPYTTIKAQNTTGLSTPLGLAVDPATADVYVPNYGNNTITGYAPPYTGGPFATVSGSLPDADAIGP
jgi:streptogramin lyase